MSEYVPGVGGSINSAGGGRIRGACTGCGGGGKCVAQAVKFSASTSGSSSRTLAFLGVCIGTPLRLDGALMFQFTSVSLALGRGRMLLSRLLGYSRSLALAAHLVAVPPAPQDKRADDPDHQRDAAQHADDGQRVHDQPSLRCSMRLAMIT